MRIESAPVSCGALSFLDVNDSTLVISEASSDSVTVKYLHETDGDYCGCIFPSFTAHMLRLSHNSGHCFPDKYPNITRNSCSSHLWCSWESFVQCLGAFAQFANPPLGTFDCI